MKKLKLLSIFLLITSCQTQKFDTLIFNNKEKMNVIITDQSLAYIRYHLPFDTTTRMVRTRKLKMVKFAKPTLSEGVLIDEIKFIQY
jgi:hypothetical protein